MLLNFILEKKLTVYNSLNTTHAVHLVENMKMKNTLQNNRRKSQNRMLIEYNFNFVI